MNNFKSVFFIGLLLGVVTGYLALGGYAVVTNLAFAKKQCSAEDKKWANQFPKHFVFGKASSLLWKALCKEEKSVLLLSASEGGGKYKFSQAFKNIADIESWEMRGAHRGIKSLAYLLATPHSKERLSQQPIVAFLNPVYFSFAADTDDAAMLRSSISPLSFMIVLPSLQYRLKTLFLAYPFVAFKNLGSEEKLLNKTYRQATLTKGKAPIKPAEKTYDFTHHMYKNKVSRYKDSLRKDEVSFLIEPTHSMFLKAVEVAKSENIPLCLVLLPFNRKHLQALDRDDKAISQEISSNFDQLVPEDMRVNLMNLGETPYLFQDSMHFTDYGVHLISEHTIESQCFQRISK